MIIKNGTVFTDSCQFKSLDIELNNTMISNISPSIETDSAYIDAFDCYIIPGLVDIHFHGCMGVDFCDGTKDAIQAISDYEISSGVTSICPATMTLPSETLTNICLTASNYNNSTSHSPLVGINLEGPFISEKKKGAQNSLYIQGPDSILLQELQQKANGLIKLVAIAPETNGALELISSLQSQFVFSIAHTTSDYKTAAKAFALGASHVTHLYNAMPPFSHRKPGVIGAAFDSPNTNVELICDGIHIHPSVVRSTFQLFGDDRVILISDSMMATGMPDGNYSLGGQSVVVKGNTATLSDGTLAGSVTNLFDCMNTAIKMGIQPEKAITAATRNPAKAIHIFDQYGSITEGKIANLLILNKDFSLKSVIYQGQLRN